MHSIPKFSVVIPFFQEEENVEKVIAAVVNVMKTVGELYEVICIDDGSTDNTWSILQQEAVNRPEIRAFQLSRNFGKESALCAGMDKARGEAVITMDGDMQHPPELIPEFIRVREENNANVVEGIKIDRGKETFFSRLGAKTFYAILSKFSGYDLTGASDFKLMDKYFMNAWRQMPERSIFFRGMCAWLGFKHAEVPFEVAPRKKGKTKWSFFSLIKFALSGVTAFSSLPLHIITISGFIFLIFAVILGAQTLYNKLAGIAVSGFATVILLLLIIGSLLMIGIGITGEYISRIYNEVKMRPRYIVSQSVDKYGSNSEE
ncbi:glycosyl transferase [bacterium SM23_31]|nr:MAG: glycosyl transferase [bacterium SM23_31]